MAKEIVRPTHEGEIVEPAPKSKGVPAGDRGNGTDNSGKRITSWRAGRGAV